MGLEAPVLADPRSRADEVSNGPEEPGMDAGYVHLRVVGEPGPCADCLAPPYSDAAIPIDEAG